MLADAGIHHPSSFRNASQFLVMHIIVTFDDAARFSSVPALMPGDALNDSARCPLVVCTKTLPLRTLFTFLRGSYELTFYW